MFGNIWPIGVTLLLMITIGMGAEALRRPTVTNGTSRQTNLDRAVAAYTALQRYFHLPGVKLYQPRYPEPDRRPYSEVWPYSQAMAGTIDMLPLSGNGYDYAQDVRERLGSLSWYWNGNTSPPGYDSYVRPPLGNGGDRFYDDNIWIGLALVQLYQTTGNVGALTQASQLFDLAVSGWDTDPSHPAPGGVFWSEATWGRTRNTVSTANGAKLGLYLYQATGQPYYFDWAIKMYAWTNQYMLAPNGLFWDHVDIRGNIRTNQWSYNQGAMIGANVLLYRATGDAEYLARAERIADAALDHYGDGGYFNTQPAVFNAIFFKNLLLLHTENSKDRYIQAVQAYADRAWENARDPRTGLFDFRSSRNFRLLDQAAMVQIYACLAWDERDYRKIA